MTSAVAASLARVADDLTTISARWALIGGFAVSARAQPRFTRDVDVCVVVATDEQAEGVVRALSSGVEEQVVDAAESLEILPHLIVPVARAAHLVVLKLLARDDETRPQDGADLRSLRPTLTSGDEDEVLRLAALVTERGFHRDRDLITLARAYLATP